MLSRALILATVTLLIGDLATAPAHAQATNLEAGKSPSQIFAGTCTACHKSPRGLLKTVPAGSLPSFLKQHYTTSPDMAGLLSSYLISNGATDTRKDGKPEKPGAPVEQLDRQGRRLHTATPEPEKPEAKPEAKPGAKPEAKPEAEPRQAAKPDADGVNPQGEERRGRNGKRLARPGEAPDAGKPTAEGRQAPAQAAGTERGPDGRKLTAKQRLSKRGKRGAEEPKDTSRPDTNKDEPATAGPAKEDKPAAEPAKEEASKPEGVKPSGETKPETAKSETAKSESAKVEAAEGGRPASCPRCGPIRFLRSAPATTPEPAAGASARPAAAAAPSASPAAQSAAVESTPPTVSVAPAPPAPAPAGPPAPPISK